MTRNSAAPIHWQASFATGVDEIDEQHRILINTLNGANNLLTDASSLQVLDQITKDLLSYALYHFEAEEELMHASGYAEAMPEEMRQHLDEHRKFSATVVGVREKIQGGHRVPRDELLSFLNNWLVDHILQTDKKLGTFMSAKS